MIPLKDTIPSRTYPIINIAVIVINCLVFFYEVSLGEEINRFILSYGAVPRRFFLGEGGEGFDPFSRFYQVFTSMFLHGGWLHIGGNMLYLWIFGDNVEDRLGHLRYLVFYLASGTLACLTQLVLYPQSPIPIVGASGAIAGVLGAYFLLYPYARVVTLVPVFFFLTLMEIPAFIFLFFWIFIQFISGAASINTYSAQLSGGVAWWAHIGGFISGMVLLYFLKPPRRFRSREGFWS